MEKLKKLALSESKLGLERLINEHFFSFYYIITDDMRIYNASKKQFLDGYTVKVKGSKWYFCSIMN